jgi:hypothetical protein
MCGIEHEPQLAVVRTSCFVDYALQAGYIIGEAMRLVHSRDYHFRPLCIGRIECSPLVPTAHAIRNSLRATAYTATFFGFPALIRRW